MTGVQVYMVRVDGQEVMIAATNMIDAIDTDYYRYLEDEDLVDGVANRECYDSLLDQVVCVGEIEIVTGGAMQRLHREAEVEAP